MDTTTAGGGKHRQLEWQQVWKGKKGTTTKQQKASKRREQAAAQHKAHSILGPYFIEDEEDNALTVTQ
jgi:hypothetical protein